MRKRINKILWYGSELENGKAKVPSVSVEENGLDGLNEGELYISNNEIDPALFIRTSNSKVVRLGEANYKPFKFEYDESIDALVLSRTDGKPAHFLATGALSTRALGNIEEEGTGGGMDYVYNVDDFSKALDSFNEVSETDTFNAYAIRFLYEMVKSIENSSTDTSYVDGKIEDVNKKIDTNTAYLSEWIRRTEETLQGNIDAVESALQENIDTVAGDLHTLRTTVNDFLTGTDTDTIINRWKELESFLNGYTETSTLAELLSGKADKATTLAGYGITNAYTKTEVDNKITSVNTSVTTLQTTVSGHTTSINSLQDTVSGHTTSINSLQGYFTNGVANFASRLSDGAEYKAWGQVFFKDGKPVNVSGEGTFTQVNADSVLLRGKARLSYDSTLDALLLTKDDGTAVHFLASGAVATRGLGEIEEGGGGTGTGVDLLNVTSDIIPIVGGNYSLGSSANAWKMIYANGGIIGNTYIDNARVIFGTYIQGQSWAINPDGSASLGSITSNGETVATRNWVNSQSFAKTSDLSNYVTLNSAQTISGKKTFTGGITVNNGITASHLYSVDYLDSSELIINAEKVNFTYYGDDADVQIGLINGYKPLTLGNTSFSPALTSGMVIGTITIGGESKTIYAPSSSKVDLSNYVTLDGEQTITGSKYFSDLNANSIYLQGFELKPYNPDNATPDRLMYDGYVLLDEYNYGEYLDSAYVKKGSDTVTGQLGFSGSTYPNIYGNGNFLVLSSASDGLYGLTIDKQSAAIRARLDKTTRLGTSSIRWSDVYSVLGNFSGQITSSVADGTAPFVVASKTEVANLHSATATKLHTARTLWGQSFDGSGNVSGNLTGVGTNITGSSQLIISSTNGDIAFRYNSDESKSVVLNATQFKPYNSANGLLDLGASNARWKVIYGQSLNLSGNAIIGGLRLQSATPSFFCYYDNATSATTLIQEVAAGTLKFSGNTSTTDYFKMFLNMTNATIKFYSMDNEGDAHGNEMAVMQTCFGGQDPETSDWVTNHEARCNLLLQPRGGQVYVGYTPTDVQSTYSLNVHRKMKLYGSSSDYPEVLLYRDGVSSWKIMNNGGNLIFQNNYTTAVQSSYFDVLKLNYNSGNTTLKGSLYGGSAIYSNGKTGMADGKAGFYAGSGYIGITGATPVINFHYGNSTSSTSAIKEVTSGTLGLGTSGYNIESYAFGKKLNIYGDALSTDGPLQTALNISTAYGDFTNVGIGIRIGQLSNEARAAKIYYISESTYANHGGIAFYNNEDPTTCSEKLRLTNNGNLIPKYNTSTQSLGSSNARWVAYLNSVDVSGDATIGGETVATQVWVNSQLSSYATTSALSSYATNEALNSESAARRGSTLSGAQLNGQGYSVTWQTSQAGAQTVTIPAYGEITDGLAGIGQNVALVDQWLIADLMDYIAEVAAGGNVGLTSVASDIIPDGNLTRKLGSSSNRWSLLYVNSINAGTIAPRTDNGWDLGMTTFRWRNLYAVDGHLDSLTIGGETAATQSYVTSQLGSYATTSALSNYVTLNTEQTISERKNFSKGITGGLHSIEAPTSVFVGLDSTVRVYGGLTIGTGDLTTPSIKSDSVLPKSNSSGSIGSSSSKWRNGYINNLYSDVIYADTLTSSTSPTLSVTAASLDLCSCQLCSYDEQNLDVWSIDYSGNAYFQSVTQTSDIRYKNIKENIHLELSDIAAAPTFKFKWNNETDGKIHLGTSAQYWQEIASELVTENKKTGKLGLDYSTAALVSAISIAREVNTMKMWQTSTTDRIEELEDKVKKLEEENKALRELLNSK